jgi:hypothetical protein
MGCQFQNNQAKMTAKSHCNLFKIMLKIYGEYVVLTDRGTKWKVAGSGSDEVNDF